MIASSHLYCRT